MRGRAADDATRVADPVGCDVTFRALVAVGWVVTVRVIVTGAGVVALDVDRLLTLVRPQPTAAAAAISKTDCVRRAFATAGRYPWAGAARNVGAAADDQDGTGPRERLAKVMLVGERRLGGLADGTAAPEAITAAVHDCTIAFAGAFLVSLAILLATTSSVAPKDATPPELAQVSGSRGDPTIRLAACAPGVALLAHLAFRLSAVSSAHRPHR